MPVDLQSINDEIKKHGEITLQPVFPKEWKKAKRFLCIALPDYPEEGSIEFFIPEGLSPVFKENLVGLVQQVSYSHQFKTITISEEHE